jgi:hypothetical protein
VSPATLHAAFAKFLRRHVPRRPDLSRYVTHVTEQELAEAAARIEALDEVRRRVHSEVEVALSALTRAHARGDLPSDVAAILPTLTRASVTLDESATFDYQREPA